MDIGPGLGFFFEATKPKEYVHVEESVHARRISQLSKNHRHESQHPILVPQFPTSKKKVLTFFESF